MEWINDPAHTVSPENDEHLAYVTCIVNTVQGNHKISMIT